MAKGVTIIELLVTMSMILILAAVLFLGKTQEEKKLTLQIAAYNLMQQLRETQEMAMGAEEASCGGGAVTYSFGLYFKNAWEDHYVIFADCDGNHNRQGAGQEDIREIYVEKGVRIIDVGPSASLSVLFEPPDPTIYINQDDWGVEAEITLAVGSDSKKVKINTAGRIEIE